MAYRPAEQRRFAAQRRAQNSKPSGDIWETALRSENPPRPVKPSADERRAGLAANVVDVATFGHGPQVLGALSSPLKGRGSYDEEAALARQRLRASAPPPQPPRRRPRGTPPVSTDERIAGGAATLLDTVTLGNGDQVLGTLLSRFKGRGSYDDEVALSKRLRRRFRE